MKVAIDLRSLIGGKISGVENYAINAANAFVNSGADVFGILNSYKDAKVTEVNSRLEVRKSRIPNKIFNASLLSIGVPKFESLYGDFDCLWMPDVRPFAIKDKTKLAVTVHDLSPVIHPEFYSFKRRLWHRAVNYRRTYQRADLIFTISEYTKYDLHKQFGIDNDKIAVVYPGIDHLKFKTNLDERIKHKVRDKYGLPASFILAMSTVEPRKNFDNLVQAFEKIGHPETYLVIVGRLGWLYQNLLKRIERSPKKKRIKLIGYVDEQDKPYLISQAKAVCYPSYYEGFGFVPLEAMACGVPAITSARTAMPEVCADAALLVEPYQQNDLVDGLDQILSDQRLREYYINKGLARVKQFSWKKCGEEIKEHLDRLV